jgi:hypothetical protein
MNHISDRLVCITPPPATANGFDACVKPTFGFGNFNFDGLGYAGCALSQRCMQNLPILGSVDARAGKHGIALGRKVDRIGKSNEFRQGLLIDTLPREVKVATR